VSSILTRGKLFLFYFLFFIYLYQPIMANVLISHLLISRVGITFSKPCTLRVKTTAFIFYTELYHLKLTIFDTIQTYWQLLCLLPHTRSFLPKLTLISFICEQHTRKVYYYCYYYTQSSQSARPYNIKHCFLTETIQQLSSYFIFIPHSTLIGYSRINSQL